MEFKIVKLTDISKPKQWKNLPSSELTEEGYSVYGANGIIGKYTEFNHEFPTLAITCRGATCGSLHITNPKSYINSNAMALDNLSDEVNIKYLYYALLKRGFKDVITGSAQPQITGEGLSNVKIPVPSLQNQIYIAEILTQAKNLISARKKSIILLDELLKSVFIEKFIKKEYPIVKLQEITLKITDGEHAKPNYLETGLPFISVKNISKGSLDFTDCKFVSNDDHIKFNKRCNPEFEDIIYTKVGATYGRAVVVNTIEPFSLYVSVALIKPDKTKVNPYFLNAAINHPFVKRQADKSIKGAGVPDLHLIEIKSFKIPFPPIEKQIEFAIIVEKIEALRKEYEASLKELENMYGVLSQKAFKGELNLSKVNLELFKEEIKTPLAGSLEPQIEVENLPVFQEKEKHIKDMSLDEYYGIPEDIIAKYGSIENHHQDWEFLLKKFFHNSPIDLSRLEEIYYKLFYQRGHDFEFEDWKAFIFDELSKSKSYLKQKFNTETNQLELLINEIKKS